MPHTPVHIELSNAGPTQRRPTMTPQERAARDAAQMGGSAVQLLVPVSFIPAVVTFGFMLYLIAQVAQSPEQVLGGSLIAVFITAMIALLPVTALRMERANPQAAKHARILWAALVAVGVIAAAVYFSSARAGGNMGLVLLALCAISIPMSGVLPLWATMALGDVPEPVVANAPMVEAVSLTPIIGGGDRLREWWDYAVRQHPGAEVTFDRLYVDYIEKCEGICNPLDIRKFGKILTSMTEVPNSGISKRASNGKVIYSGIDLVSQDQGIVEMVPLQLR